MQIKTTGWHSHLSVRLAPIKKLDYTWVCQDVRKGSHTRLLDGQTQTASTQDNPTVSIKVTDVRAPWLTISCLRIIGTYGEWLPYKSIYCRGQSLMSTGEVVCTGGLSSSLIWNSRNLEASRRWAIWNWSNHIWMQYYTTVTCQSFIHSIASQGVG